MIDHRRVVEIPRLRILAVGSLRIVVAVATGISATSIPAVFAATSLRNGVGLAASLKFLAVFEVFDDAVDGLVALHFGHGAQQEQTVLEMHGRSVRHQFIEHR